MIDINAISLCIALINIFLCVALFVAWRFQKVYAGFGFWVLANLVLALSYLLMAWLRHVIPGITIILVHNLLFIFVAWLRLEGLHRFLDIRRRWYPHFMVIFFCGLSFWYFSHDHAMRTVVLCGVLGGYLFKMTWVLISNARSEIRVFYRLMACVFFLYGLVLTGRAITALISPSQILLPVATWSNTAFFLFVMLLDIGVIFSFLMMNDKRLALELGATEERLSRVQGSISDGFLVLDNGLRITYSNEAATRMLGRRREEVLGWEIGHALPETKGSIFHEKCTASVREKKFCSFETSFDQEASKSWYAVRIYPFVDGISIFLQDITDRKRAEEALKESQAGLEKRVQERTSELSIANEKLRREIEEHKRTEEALRESENRLRLLSSQLLSSQEMERKRISMELHDEMGQALTAIEFNLTEMEGEFPSGVPSGIREKLEETRSIVEQTLGQVREIALFLRPSMLDDLGLVPTVRWHLNRFSQRTNMEVRFETTGLEERMDPDAETVLYRILQESLNNIGRHAGAKQVTVKFHRTGDRVNAVIEDDGKGFDVNEILADKAPGSGIGLIGMQERASLIGGRLTIASRKGDGTRISLEVPLRKKEVEWAI